MRVLRAMPCMCSKDPLNEGHFVRHTFVPARPCGALCDGWERSGRETRQVQCAAHRGVGGGASDNRRGHNDRQTTTQQALRHNSP